MKYLILLFSTLFLFACGGGDSSSEQPVSPVASESPSDNTGSAINELSVATSFDFTTDVSVTVNVAANLVNERAYLNVCKADSVVINDDNCFFRSPVTASGLTRKIVIPHNEQLLKADIWYYDVLTQPLSYTWSFDKSASEQVFLLGNN